MCDKNHLLSCEEEMSPMKGPFSSSLRVECRDTRNVPVPWPGGEPGQSAFPLSPLLAGCRRLATVCLSSYRISFWLPLGKVVDLSVLKGAVSVSRDCSKSTPGPLTMPQIYRKHDLCGHYICMVLEEILDSVFNKHYQKTLPCPPGLRFLGVPVVHSGPSFLLRCLYTISLGRHVSEVAWVVSDSSQPYGL